MPRGDSEDDMDERRRDKFTSERGRGDYGAGRYKIYLDLCFPEFQTTCDIDSKKFFIFDLLKLSVAGVITVSEITGALVELVVVVLAITVVLMMIVAGKIVGT